MLVYGKQDLPLPTHPPPPPSPVPPAVWYVQFFAVYAMFPANAVYPTQVTLQSDHV